VLKKNKEIKSTCHPQGQIPFRAGIESESTGSNILDSQLKLLLFFLNIEKKKKLIKKQNYKNNLQHALKLPKPLGSTVANQ
jgi:hypothetical protein